MKRSPSAVAAVPPVPPVPAPSPGPAAPTAVWTCEARELLAGGAPGEKLKKSLTVGEKFLLDCAGPAAALRRDSLSLRLPKDAEHALRLLETRALESGNAAFVATTYKTGEVKLQGVTLTDGAVSVRLDGIQVQATSVIDPQTNPEGKPYGPFDPLSLGYPPWIWLGVAAVMAAGAASVGFAVVRRSRRRNLARALAAHPASGSPYARFNKEMRALARSHPIDERKPWPAEAARAYVREVDQAFRWFLARELLIPTIEAGRAGSVGRALAELRRNDVAAWRGHGRALERALAELSRALGAGSKITMTDGQQLAELARKTADAIERSLRERGFAAGLASGREGAGVAAGVREALRRAGIGGGK